MYSGTWAYAYIFYRYEHNHEDHETNRVLKTFLFSDVIAGIVYFLTLKIVYLFTLQRNLPSWLSTTTNEVNLMMSDLAFPMSCYHFKPDQSKSVLSRKARTAFISTYDVQKPFTHIVPFLGN